MVLITCGECKAEVSDTAETCPKCGARVKPKSSAWKWIVGVLVGGPVAFLGVGAILMANDPQHEAKSNDRRRFELCMQDFNDPLKDPVAKRTVIGPVCERFRAEFIAKYGREP